MLLSTSGSPGSRRTRGIARSDRPVDPHLSAPFRRFKGGDQQGGTLDSDLVPSLEDLRGHSRRRRDGCHNNVPWRSRLVRTT